VTVGRVVAGHPRFGDEPDRPGHDGRAIEPPDTTDKNQYAVVSG
jgi:hypothetical protein